MKILYWATTGLTSVMSIMGIFFMNSPQAAEGAKHLGLPTWFHTELTIGKCIGGLIIILPFVPSRIKEWAYVALGIDMLSAFIALMAVDGPVPMSFSPFLAFALLLGSYVSFHRLNKS